VSSDRARSDRAGKAAVLQPGEVGHRRLGSGNYYEVRSSKFLRGRHPPHVDERFAHQRLKLVEVRDVRQPRYGDRNERSRMLGPGALPFERIFGGKTRQVEMREHSERRDPGPFLEHDKTRVEQRRVTTKLVDDEAANARAIVGG
jgi:hypothetical protein